MQDEKLTKQQAVKIMICQKLKSEVYCKYCHKQNITFTQCWPGQRMKSQSKEAYTKIQTNKFHMQ